MGSIMCERQWPGTLEVPPFAGLTRTLISTVSTAPRTPVPRSCVILLKVTAVALTNGESVSGIDIQVDPGPIIRGRIVDAISGLTIAQGRVAVFDESDRLVGRYKISGVTGQYQTTALEPGTYTLVPEVSPAFEVVTDSSSIEDTYLRLRCLEQPAVYQDRMACRSLWERKMSMRTFRSSRFFPTEYSALDLCNNNSRPGASERRGLCHSAIAGCESARGEKGRDAAQASGNIRP